MGSGSKPNLTGKCLICGSDTRLVVKSRGEYRDTCSVSCGTKLGQKKLAETCTVHPSQTPEVQERRKATNLKKYGAATPMQQDWAAEKRSARMAAAEVISKIKQTTFENHGVFSPLQSEAIRQKAKNTMKDRYGADHNMRDPAAKKRAIDSARSSYTLGPFKEKLEKLLGTLNISPDFQLSEYRGTGESYRWKHHTCGSIFDYVLHSNGSLPRCPNCHPKHVSLPQKILEDLLTELGVEFVSNCRSVLPNKRELDIWIPSKKLAIEVNGVYWHSEDRPAAPILKKTLQCSEMGITLLHFWDLEIINKSQIVLDIIKAKLGLLERKFQTRKCKCKKIDKNTAAAFLKLNHLDGSTAAVGLCLGLYYEDELVSVSTFSKSRFSKDGQYELLRFATLLNTTCAGALTKFIKEAKAHYQVDTIMSFANRRISNGSSYAAIAKSPPVVVSPGFFYAVGFGENAVIISRMKAQRHRMRVILGEKFDESKSCSENARINNWLKITDCGNLKFVL